MNYLIGFELVNEKGYRFGGMFRYNLDIYNRGYASRFCIHA
jgi:hypothetical protein